MIPPDSHSAYSRNDTGRVMTSEEFDQVIEAIATGRYSWACVLILRIAGYNPLHYLPYRTYRRLIKENTQAHLAQLKNDTPAHLSQPQHSFAAGHNSKWHEEVKHY
jgi:hypothetical protein